MSDRDYSPKHAGHATATDLGHQPRHAKPRPAPKAKAKTKDKPRNHMLQMRDVKW